MQGWKIGIRKLRGHHTELLPGKAFFVGIHFVAVAISGVLKSE
jgi:hypothetical protein